MKNMFDFMEFGKLQQRRLAILAVAAVLAVVLDQWSKTVIVERFVLGESLPVWGEWIKLTLVHNYGVAFGFMNQADPVQHYVLLSFNIVVVLVLIGLVLWMRLLPSERFGVGLVISGAIGNIIDRFNYGYVIDFVDIGAQVWRWPVFNVADSCVTVGVTCWLIASLFFSHRSLATEKHESSPQD